MPDTQKNEREVLKRAPTLYTIIVFKLVKGVLLVAAALAFYTLSDNDLPAIFQQFLHVVRANPERKFWSDLAVKVGDITESQMVHVAVGALIFSLFDLVEGIGLMFRWPWAGWLAIGEAVFFVPIEMHNLIQKFTWHVLIILALNVVIVWYLFQNRAWLFRHHHHHHH